MFFTNVVFYSNLVFSRLVVTMMDGDCLIPWVEWFPLDKFSADEREKSYLTNIINMKVYNDVAYISEKYIIYKGYNL